MNSHIALLRGINVGGKTIKMDVLKATFESLGFKNVKTILATGNVLFDSEETDTKKLITVIEAKLATAFGFEVTVILRTKEYVKEIVQRDPFKNIVLKPELRLYVSFLAEKTRQSIEVPYVSPEKNFRIISMTGCELFSLLEVTGKTTDAMNVIEKKFGKNVTTRNWNTVKKIVSVV